MLKSLEGMPSSRINRLWQHPTTNLIQSAAAQESCLGGMASSGCGAGYGAAHADGDGLEVGKKSGANRQRAEHADVATRQVPACVLCL